jgi:hypothetical protein
MIDVDKEAEDSCGNTGVILCTIYLFGLYA